ncbi:molybdenum cofactor biosynthesis protein MoaE [Elongatibacter sediminis]|uniref:Molybdopterin synthase catalytic subunit n=1 Tax=Elongatibacter sediminis TaxID=3119006 RepID=A0AAW9RNR8_9GAMM
MQVQNGDFSISERPIDMAAFRAALQDEQCGAFVLFEGWVRNHNDGREVGRLEYEAYIPMAEPLGREIVAEALQRFDISRAAAVHRQGNLGLGEPAVVVGVASSHRDAAFRACRYIIDEIKHRVPIWKKEHYADGSTEWVDCRLTPGVKAEETAG